jgi:hypothetical protein
VGAQEHALLDLRFPSHDQIFHLDLLARKRVFVHEHLPLGFAPQSYKVILQQPLLLKHPSRTCGPRADLAEFLEVTEGTLGVQRRRWSPPTRRDLRSAGGSTAWFGRDRYR